MANFAGPTISGNSYGFEFILGIKTVNLHFFPHHQFVSSLTATLVLIGQIHVVPAAEKSHLVTARPQFVGDTALHVGRVAGSKGE